MKYESNLLFIKIKNGKFEKNKEFLVIIRFVLNLINYF